MHTYRGKPGFNRFVADSPVFADVADIDTVLLDGAIGLDSDELVAIEGLAGCGEGGCWDAWQLDRFVVAPALQGLLECGGHGADRGAVLEPVVRERVLDREELDRLKRQGRLRKGRICAVAWYQGSVRPLLECGGGAGGSGSRDPGAAGRIGFGLFG